MQLEERDLARAPASVQDIPESSRWKLVRGARYQSSGLVRLTFGRSPFAGIGEIRTIDIDFGKRDPRGQTATSTACTALDAGLPDVLIERGGAGFLQADGSYHHLQIHEFYFPIPRG